MIIILETHVKGEAVIEYIKHHDHYTYRVTWSADDNEYVGLCAEFPSISWLAKTPEGALRGIRKVIADVIDDMKRNGEEIPEPIAKGGIRGQIFIIDNSVKMKDLTPSFS